MVHKPKHKVHSFRGLLASGGQDEINLERSNVNLAYRLIKFQTVGSDPTTLRSESVTKIYREEQTSIDVSINFDDTDLLGVAVYKNYEDAHRPLTQAIMFDNTLFSRNIYVTQKDTDDNPINYYIELEEVPVGAATLMQLKLGTARKLIGAKMGA